MNRKTGKQLHAALDALRFTAMRVPGIDTTDQESGETFRAILSRPVSGQPLAALTLLADDIECDGMGGPFATHLSYRISIETDATRKLFFQRLLGNVKKFNEEYGQ